MIFELTQRGRKLAGAGIIGAGIGLIAAVLAYARPAIVERGELWSYDMRARAAAEPERASDDIVLVHIGETDLKNVERFTGLTWPWPRVFYGYIADYAIEGGAEAVILDFIFQDRGAWGAEDVEEFADLLRDNERTVVGMAARIGEGDDEAAKEEQQLYVGRLGAFDDRGEALRAGVRLLAWNTRVFLAPGEPTTVYYGGMADPNKLMEAWGRLVSVEALEDLMGGDEAMPPETEPLSDEVAGGEVTGESIIGERLALDVPGDDDVDLPVIRDTPPIAVIAEASPAVGAVSQRPDPDGVMRRYAYFFRRGEHVFPSLPMAGFMLANPDVPVSFEGGELVVGDRHIPVGDDGRAVIRYHGEHVYDEVEAWDILASINRLAEGEEPLVEQRRFEGKYVIVSATAAALRDWRVTPVSDRHLGAAVNAHALDNLIQGDVVRRAGPLTDALLAWLLAVLGAMLVTVSTMLRRSVANFLVGAGTAAGILLGYIVLSAWLMTAHGYWLATFVPVSAAGIAMVGSVMLSSTLERRDRRFVQEALGRYTSPALVAELVAHPEKLSLEWGESRDMSVYFSDIAGFTTLSEKLSAENVVALLNDYLTHMTDIVLRHGGVVDKYIGDAIMAFWGAPVENANHAREAVLAAIEMKQTCDALRPGWKERFGVDLFARAGVNTGHAVVGNMGSLHKYNYTVMGDMVNLAARLEGANKPYGTYLMVSEATYAAVADRVVARELDYLAVKGKEEPVTVYEILGEEGSVDETVLAALERFAAGIEKYRNRDFEGAITEFEAALEARPDDGPSKCYIDRCRHFLEDPPGEDWDGVWRMKEK